MNPNNPSISVEQMSFNNMVNIEALLDALISAGIISEMQFQESKRAIEQRILNSQRGGGQ